MNYSKYDEVINGKNTYKEIAKLLLKNDAVGIGWTDEDSTHLDIIFMLGISKFGSFQRGIKENHLFVSVIDYTSYAFDINSIPNLGYIEEKLRMNNECGNKLSELIIEVLIGLRNSVK